MIIFNVDGTVAFEVSFLKTYNCWSVFCNKKQQFRVIDPNIPLYYFIVYVVLIMMFDVVLL